MKQWACKSDLGILISVLGSIGLFTRLIYSLESSGLSMRVVGDCIPYVGVVVIGAALVHYCRPPWESVVGGVRVVLEIFIVLAVVALLFREIFSGIGFSIAACVLFLVIRIIKARAGNAKI